MTTSFRYIPREKIQSKSNIRFSGNFSVELEKTLMFLDEYLEKELRLHYQIDSIHSEKNQIRIRVNDSEKLVKKVVTIILRYHHDDEWYGNIHIELDIREVSKKTLVHFVGTFSIKDRAKIQ
jgi:hypothetical protein